MTKYNHNEHTGEIDESYANDIEKLREEVDNVGGIVINIQSNVDGFQQSISANAQKAEANKQAIEQLQNVNHLEENGISGEFTTVDNKKITIENGQIISITTI